VAQIKLAEGEGDFFLQLFVHDVFDSHVSWKMKNNKVRRFRLTIANKLLLGFPSCGLLTILIGITTLYSLRQLDQINNRITERDIPLV